MTELYFILLTLACYVILYAAARGGREILLVVMSFMCTMAFLFAAKIVRVAGYPLVPSAPFLGVTFYAATLLQEFYGPRDARKILFINLGVMLGFTALGLLVRQMQMYAPLEGSLHSVGTSYDMLLDFFPQALGAALVAFSASYALNFGLTKILHRVAGDRFFALRGFASVALSNLLDIGVFVALAYPWTSDTPATILTTWTIRLICIAAGVPVLWAIKRRYMQAGRTELSAF